MFDLYIHACIQCRLLSTAKSFQDFSNILHYEGNFLENTLIGSFFQEILLSNGKKVLRKMCCPQTFLVFHGNYIVVSKSWPPHNVKLNKRVVCGDGVRLGLLAEFSFFSLGSCPWHSLTCHLNAVKECDTLRSC